MDDKIKEYIGGLLEAIENDMFVQDDEGLVWYWSQGRIRLVSAELEMLHIHFEDVHENGYGCKNLTDGIRVLREYGYITLDDK